MSYDLTAAASWNAGEVNVPQASREGGVLSQEIVEIDGARHSGSGTIVRLSVALSALTGKPVHVVNARQGRPKPGLRPQHVQVVTAIGQLVDAQVTGLSPGSREFYFRPGRLDVGRHYRWDIGSAGSTSLLALAVLPVLAYARVPVHVELRGGLFQDYAPSFFYLRHVILPLLARMGFSTHAEMERPGYVPRGDGIVSLQVEPLRMPPRGLQLDEPGSVDRIRGIALASHLEEREVSERMARTARKVLARSGLQAVIETVDDRTSLQPGAAIALWADLSRGARLGADRVGAVRRSAEAVGRVAARQLIDDLDSGATLDRHAADQVVLFAALAEGESRFRVPAETEHLRSTAWLVTEFLGSHVEVSNHVLFVAGVGFRPFE